MYSPLLLQLLLFCGNTGFGFLLTYPCHPSLVCHSPGSISVHKGFLGHFAVRLHSGSCSTCSPQKPLGLLPQNCSPAPRSSPYLVNMVLSSHLLPVGRLLPPPQHTTELTWLQTLESKVFMQAPTLV